MQFTYLMSTKKKQEFLRALQVPHVRIFILTHFFDALFETTTWNNQIWSLVEVVSAWRQKTTFSSKFLIRSYQLSA